MHHMTRYLTDNLVDSKHNKIYTAKHKCCSLKLSNFFSANFIFFSFRVHKSELKLHNH